MQISLEEILFNHGGTPGTPTGALTLRRNETQVVTLPEWRRNTCLSPGCAPVAYAIDELQSPITIKAKFSSTDLKDKEVEVRAVAPAGDVLGNVAKTIVRLGADGQSEFATFELSQSKLSEVGVGAHTTNWHWEFHNPRLDRWIEFQRTSHRVYSVLAPPTEPWKAELPWTEVLEIACQWAEGAKDLDTAAERITERMNGLGAGLVKYLRTPTYAHAKFDCSAFLQLLKDGVGKAQTVNCDDCATVVSTFANILGCDLWQSGMGYDFATNYILLIGQSEWRRRGFPRHAVAWKDASGPQNPLFDACLQVDGDGSPNTLHHQALLAANISFEHQRDTDSYKFCLLNGGQCEPKPLDERKRRPIGRSYLGSRNFTSTEFLEFLQRHYKYDSWANNDEELLPGGALTSSLSDFLSHQPAFADWNLNLFDTEATDLVSVVNILLKDPAEAVNKLVDITLYECANGQSPSEFLLALLGEFHLMDVTRLEDDPIGDVAFVEPNGNEIVFKRGRNVAFVRSVGKQSISVGEIARVIEQYFRRFITIERTR